MGRWSFFVWPPVVSNSEDTFTAECGLMFFQRQCMTLYGGIMQFRVAAVAERVALHPMRAIDRRLRRKGSS